VLYKQTYQLGRAFTAVTLQEDTVNVARSHALKLIEVEERLGIFWELPIQHFFLSRPLIMTWINWIYSFIHIPGTIAFLVWLYYYTITRNRINESQPGKQRGTVGGSPAGPLLYQARRRTLAVCNLLAFVVFTLWPCMPPRLLSDPRVEGPEGELARSYGFIDTVHGANGTGSVWTENRFCNQYGTYDCIILRHIRVPYLTMFAFFSGNAVLAFRLLSHDWNYHYDHPPSTAPPKNPPFSPRLGYWAAHSIVAQDDLSGTRFPLSVHYLGGYRGHSQPLYCGCNCWGSGVCPGMVVKWSAAESVAGGGLLSLAGSDP
jgi:hypothetical protein